MAYELHYWEQRGLREHDLHLATYRRGFPVGLIDYSQEQILDVGSGAISIFENIAPQSASVLPLDILADAYNKLAPDKQFMICNEVPKGRRFSLITLFNMIDHVDDPEDLLTFLQPLLEETGQVWLAVHLYRPHGAVGHPQMFSCKSIVTLVSRFFSIEACTIIREGAPLPYMWCGVLRVRAYHKRGPACWVFRTYLRYGQLQLTRLLVKVLKLSGLRTFLPQAWRF